MRFHSPFFLILLLFVPFFLSWLREREKKGVRSSIKYSDVTVFKKIPPSKNILYRKCLPLIRALVIVLLIFAMARPQSSKSTEEITTEGIDIILALDVSGSMKAEDFKPNNRLYAAKEVAKEFIKGRTNDRLGMVVFSGTSFTQVPLTLDYGVVLTLLDKVRIGMIEDGTAIGMAIANCANRLRESTAKSKVVILLTDGVNNVGRVDPVTAAKAAAALGIRVYTVGMGKEGGAPIPTYDPFRGKVYIRDPRTGGLLKTELDEKTLKKIAKLTGGSYYRATDEKKLDAIFKEISKMEKSKIGAKNYMKYRELFPIFAWLAMILFVIEMALSHTVLRKIP